MVDTQAAMPRWAMELGDQTWERILELLQEGWDSPDILRELNIPQRKLRSLQVYARRFGPRRRLIAFANFKDALLAGAVESKEDFARSLALIASYAVSDQVSPTKQLRAMEAMTDFTRVLAKLMEGDQRQEREHIANETGGEKLDRKQVADRILELYGIAGS